MNFVHRDMIIHLNSEIIFSKSWTYLSKVPAFCFLLAFGFKGSCCCLCNRAQTSCGLIWILSGKKVFLLSGSWKVSTKITVSNPIYSYSSIFFCRTVCDSIQGYQSAFSLHVKSVADRKHTCWSSICFLHPKQAECATVCIKCSCQQQKLMVRGALWRARAQSRWPEEWAGSFCRAGVWCGFSGAQSTATPLRSAVLLSGGKKTKENHLCICCNGWCWHPRSSGRVFSLHSVLRGDWGAAGADPASGIIETWNGLAGKRP